LKILGLNGNQQDSPKQSIMVEIEIARHHLGKITILVKDGGQAMLKVVV
jgi:hypothetical protein